MARSAVRIEDTWSIGLRLTGQFWNFWLKSPAKAQTPRTGSAVVLPADCTLDPFFYVLMWTRLVKTRHAFCVCKKSSQLDSGLREPDQSIRLLFLVFVNVVKIADLLIRSAVTTLSTSTVLQDTTVRLTRHFQQSGRCFYFRKKVSTPCQHARQRHQ